MSPAPPNLEEMKREAEKEREEVSESKMTGEQVSKYAFVLLYLYSSCCLCLLTFPNESPYNAETQISSP